jgi:hypothetical protein
MPPTVSAITRRNVLCSMAAVPLAHLLSGCSSGSSSTGSSTPVQTVPGTPTTASFGAAQSIPSSLFGLNESGNFTQYDGNSGFASIFASLRPAILRYPGGEIGNWFDLSTGLVLTNANPAPPSDLSGYNNNPGYTTTQLAAFLADTGATPTIVLNLLTGNMSTQITALQSAKAAGIPINYLELGNEFYLDTLAGATPYTQVFPTPASYVSVANQYAAALKAAFPSVKLGVPVWGDSGGASREAGWNAGVIPNLKNIDALIIHTYQDPTFGATSSSYPGTTAAQATETAGFTATGGVQTVLAMATNISSQQAVVSAYPGFQVWITESNLRDFVGSIAGTWCHGLYAALRLLKFLELTNLNLALLHSVTGSLLYAQINTASGTVAGLTNSPTLAANTLTATGYATQLLFAAAAGCTAAQPISFSVNPPQTTSAGGTVPSLYGWSFGNGATAVVLNLSPTEYALSIPATGFSGSATQISGNPLSFVGSTTPLTIASSPVASPLSLPAYSITVL